MLSGNENSGHHLIFASQAFLTNSIGHPCLSKRHQKLLTGFFNHSVQVCYFYAFTITLSQPCYFHIFRVDDPMLYASSFQLAFLSYIHVIFFVLIEVTVADIVLEFFFCSI